MVFGHSVQVVSGNQPPDNTLNLVVQVILTIDEIDADSLRAPRQ